MKVSASRNAVLAFDTQNKLSLIRAPDATVHTTSTSPTEALGRASKISTPHIQGCSIPTEVISQPITQSQAQCWRNVREDVS